MDELVTPVPQARDKMTKDVAPFNLSGYARPIKSHIFHDPIQRVGAAEKLIQRIPYLSHPRTVSYNVEIMIIDIATNNAASIRGNAASEESRACTKA